MTDPFKKIFWQFIAEVEDSDPEVGALFQGVREGQLTDQEAMARFQEFVSKYPQWGEEFEKRARQAFEPVLEQSLEPVSDRTEVLAPWGMTEEDLVYVPGKNRMPQLHPLVQGLIAERLQFDGDLPELRTGALPEGGSPAVPVLTTARNPVVIGSMLRTASEEVHAQILTAQAEQQGALETSLLQGGALSTQEVLGLQPVKVEGYSAGKAPALRKVKEPTIFAMSLVEKQELFTKALTSTQGRKSVVPVLEELILTQLQTVGIEARLGKMPREGVPQHRAQWTIEILGSKNEMNPRFSYIDVAAQALSHKLIAEKPSLGTTLHLRPINTVEERVVGWEAILY